MVTHAFYELLKQFFSDPATNLFPVKNHPGSVHGTLRKVEKGKAKLNPPVEVPPDFRGKILYDREACIGCQMCIKVCPSATIEFIPDGRKVKFYMARCTFCALCTEICPKKCIKMSDTFLMANTDKYGKDMFGNDMVVLDSGRFVVEEKKGPKAPDKASEPPIGAKRKGDAPAKKAEA